MRAWMATTALLTTLVGQSAFADEPRTAPRARHASPTRDEGGKGSKQEATVELVVAHGKNGGKGIDPKLSKHKELQSPPFSSYDSYDLLEAATRTLTRGKPTSLKLPDGGELRVGLEDIEEAAGKPVRLVLKATVKKPGGDESNVQVKVKPGAIFFVAGQKYDKGILVLGIKAR